MKRLNKTMRNNLERLGWVIMAWVIIFMGIFLPDKWILIPVGTFILGNILGQLK